MALGVRDSTYSQSSGSESSISVTAPTVVSGDLILIFVATDGDSAAFTAPSGFSTEVSDFDIAGGITCSLFYKVATGSEPSSWSVPVAPSERHVGIAITIEDADSAIDASGTNSGSGSTATCPTVTPTASNTLLFRLVASDAGDVSTPHGTASGYTMLQNSGYFSSAAVSAQVKTHVSGATGTEDVSLSTSTGWCSLTLCVAPAGGGAESFSGAIVDVVSFGVSLF